ncbi:MAG: DUF2975 domain-containing protein [Faecousia sp.]
MKKLSVTLKLSIAGIALCGLVLYFGAIPIFAVSMRSAYPEFANRFWPWLAFLWGSALPCYGVLFYGWRVAGEIERGNAFSGENAASLRAVARLAVLDTVYFALGNVVLFLLSMSHPGIALGLMAVCVVGVIVAAVADTLSKLIAEAARLREEQDLTI